MQVGDSNGMAGGYDSLGVAYQHLGSHRDAVACFHQALDALADSGERFYVALVRSHLGDACRIARELPAARHHYERALAIFGGLGAREADGVRQKLAALGNELPTSGAGHATEPIR